MNELAEALQAKKKSSNHFRGTLFFKIALFFRGPFLNIRT
jgi:hypothetical protein